MSNFHDRMTAQSNELLSCFSLPPVSGFDYTHQPEIKNAWVDDVVMKHPELSVKADLTFRKSINYASLGFMGDIPVNSSRHFITHSDAITNISQFLKRLNYACYKNAYRRYGKRLSVVSAVEGGIIEKTRISNNGNPIVYHYNTGRHKHAHLILSRPTHIPYADFEKLIIDNWLETKWGLWQRRIEPIRSLKRAAKYQVTTSLEALDDHNTNLH